MRSSAWPTRSPATASKVGSFVAPIWGGAGGGSAMGSRRGSQAASSPRCARPAPSASRCASSASARPAASASTLRPSVEAWDKDPEGNTKLIAETFREAGKIAEDHGEFLVAEGEICWGGMHSWRENVEPARDGRHARRRRLPGRHGALDALHPRLQRREGPHPARRLRLEGPDAARRRLQEGRRRAPSLDARLPRRPERRHRLRLGRPREDRPPLPGRPIRTASSISSSTPATGCATTRAT